MNIKHLQSIKFTRKFNPINNHEQQEKKKIGRLEKPVGRNYAMESAIEGAEGIVESLEEIIGAFDEVFEDLDDAINA